MKMLKYVAAALVALVVLAGGAAAFVAMSFDPNRYKPELVKLVKDKTGRTLSIDGNIGLAFFPSIGVALGKASLSEHGSAKVFAKIDEAHVSLALMPLLSRQVRVDRVSLTGLSVDLVRFKDGRTNFDDLTGGGPGSQQKPDAKATEMPAIDIEGIEFKGANISWRDDQAGNQVKLGGLQLSTTRIASGVPGRMELSVAIQGAKPKLDLQAKLATGYRIDFTTRAVALQGLDLSVTGDAPGAAGLKAGVRGGIELVPATQRVSISALEVTATTRDGLDAKLSAPRLLVAPGELSSAALVGQLKMVQAGRSADLKIALAAVEGKGKSASSNLQTEFSVKQDDTAVSGKLAALVSVDMAAKSAQLATTSAEATVASPAMPQKALKLAASGSTRVDWGRQTAATDLTVRVEESTIQAKLNVAGFSTPAIGFDIGIDKLDVDKYLPPKPAAAPAAAPAAGPAKPIDLAGLKGLNLNGQLRVGTLAAHGVKVEKLLAGIRAAGGRLDVSPLSASLYQGSLSGSASVIAEGNRFAVKQQLSGVAIGPLLRDLLHKDMIDGKGNVTLDVQTSGATVPVLRKALNGSAALSLRDGAVKGINLAEAFRKAKAVFGAKGASDQAANTTDKTDFSEMTASFTIRDGVAHNDDLSAKSPFLRVTGSGDINIGAETLDYTAKAAVVNSAGGQGGKDLEHLKGLTVPVRLSGPFDAPKYRIDFGAMIGDSAKQQVQQKVQEKVGDKLKGLLRR